MFMWTFQASFSYVLNHPDAAWHKKHQRCMLWNKRHAVSQSLTHQFVVYIKWSTVFIVSWYKLQNITVTFSSVKNNETMRWDFTVDVCYCCCYVDDICTKLCTWNSEITSPWLSRHCHSPVMYSPVCLYTVCNTIIIIHKAVGLNEPFLHLFFRVCDDRALHNHRVPDGSQSPLAVPSIPPPLSA